MSRWANWSSGIQTKMSLSSFMLQEEKGRPIPGDPEEIARQNGWTGKEYGWYVDGSENVVARSIQGQMYVYDTDPRAEGQVDNGNPTSAASGQTPGDKARAMGLQSNGKGSYIDPQTGQVAARTVNNELVFYDQRPGGGAVSDGAGGRALTQSAPSWQDPVTGMIIVPPAQPEDPQEQASVPDPTPAQAPDGFSAYMMKVKIDTYEKEKREREIEGEVNQKTQQMQGLGKLGELYNKAAQTDQGIEANLQAGKIDQKRAAYLSGINTENKERIERAAEQVTQDTEGMPDQFVQEAAKLKALETNIEKKLAKIERGREEMQGSKDYQTSGPEEQQVMDTEYDEENAPEVERLNKKAEAAGQAYEQNLKNGQRGKELAELQEMIVEPNYDMNQEGKRLGSGIAGIVDIIGDGNVIKSGEINMNEARILGKLHGTGVGPKLINYSPRGPEQNVDKLAMSLAPGKQLEKATKKMSIVEEQEMATSFVTKLARMHRMGISHGDLHDGNIIVNDRNEVSFVDFGMAKENYALAYLEAVNPTREDLLETNHERYSQQGLSVPFAMEKQLYDNTIKSRKFIRDYAKENGISVDMYGISKGGYGFSDQDEIETPYSEWTDTDHAEHNTPIQELGINNIPEEIWKQAIEMLYDGIE